MVILEPQPQALRNESSQRDGKKVAVRQKKQATLTTPDLVLLSLLAERPMHATKPIWSWSGAASAIGRRFLGRRSTIRWKSLLLPASFAKRRAASLLRGQSAPSSRPRRAAALRRPMLCSATTGPPSGIVLLFPHGSRFPGSRAPVFLKNNCSAAASSSNKSWLPSKRH